MRFAVKISMIAAVLMLIVSAASAQDTSSQQNRKSRLEREIAELEQQLKANSSKSANALTKLSLPRKDHINSPVIYNL